VHSTGFFLKSKHLTDTLGMKEEDLEQARRDLQSVQTSARTLFATNKNLEQVKKELEEKFRKAEEAAKELWRKKIRRGERKTIT